MHLLSRFQRFWTLPVRIYQAHWLRTWCHHEKVCRLHLLLFITSIPLLYPGCYRWQRRSCRWRDWPLLWTLGYSHAPSRRRSPYWLLAYIVPGTRLFKYSYHWLPEDTQSCKTDTINFGYRENAAAWCTPFCLFNFCSHLLRFYIGADYHLRACRFGYRSALCGALEWIKKTQGLWWLNYIVAVLEPFIQYQNDG